MESTSIYIHIPFCEVKCGYCDFYSVPRGWEDFDLQKSYVDALCQEIAERCREHDSMTVRSIFFGGGTPSLLKEKYIEKILSTLSRYFSWNHDTEVTLETNPKTVQYEKLRSLKEIGINRLSIGVQSFQDRFLQQLGRIHAGKEALQTIEQAQQAGFDNISCDLIFGQPHQTLDDWEKDLEQAIALSPHHLSCYALTIEPNTAFERLYDTGQLLMPQDDTVLEQLQWTRQTLTEQDYQPYEISNFSRRGYASQHNQHYWNYGDYIGFGVSAVGFQKSSRASSEFGLRRANPRNLQNYCTTNWQAETEIIDQQIAQREVIMLSLRTTQGLRANHYNQLFEDNLYDRYATVLETLVEEKLLDTPETGRWVLSQTGLMIADTVIGRFF